MSISRRKFMKAAGTASAFALMTPGRALPIPFPVDDNIAGYRPELVPSAEEIWALQVAANKLGPSKITGTKAHVDFVDFLEQHLKSIGLATDRDHYKLPLWEAHNWGLTVKPATGAAMKVPVSNYFPYSGETGKEGVTGELVRMEYHPPASGGGRGQTPFQVPIDVKDKIVYVDCPFEARSWVPTDRVAKYYPPSWELTPIMSAIAGGIAPPLDALKAAGALGLVLGWTSISDEQAARQWKPYPKRLEEFPALWVGKTAAAKLSALSGTGAKATLVLEATVVQDSPTDTLFAFLPGMTDDEIVIINTHTDGPNAPEENGGIGIIAMAKYFSKIPKTERKRTILFILASGHMCHAWVPSIGGFIDKHPDLIKKTVASLTVEHLGCREWLDDASGKYAPTGKSEINICYTRNEAVANVMGEALTGMPDRREAIVRGPGPGESTALATAGVPSIGYLPVPSYLFMGTPDGCMDKIDRKDMHAQVQTFLRVAHMMQSMSAADLKQGFWGGNTMNG